MRAFFYLLKTLIIAGLITCINSPEIFAQTQPGTVLVVSPHVGEVIDKEEKIRFNLFPFFQNEDFMIGRFYQLPDKQIVLEVVKKNGLTETRNFTQSEFDLTGQLIEAKAVSAPAPAPPARPATPTITSPTFGSRPGSHPTNTRLTGKVYYVILTDGMKFFATIAEKRELEYVFNTQFYGPITAAFADIRYLKEVENRLRNNEYWIPNPHDSRLYFGPTGRGIPRGEGYFQTIYGYINAVNYGLTDNFSIGTTFFLFPGVSLENSLLSLTPKISLPVSKNVNLAAGVLYASFFGETFGIVYGAGTYGNSHDHLTGGLGFGFLNNEIGKQPVFMFGGVKRVSNRISLMSENYVVSIAEDPNNFQEAHTITGGLYGLRIIWPRTNLDLAAAYYYDSSINNWGDDTFFTTYIIPVYFSFTFKFGNRSKVGRLY